MIAVSGTSISPFTTGLPLSFLPKLTFVPTSFQLMRRGVSTAPSGVRMAACSVHGLTMFREYMSLNPSRPMGSHAIMNSDPLAENWVIFRIFLPSFSGFTSAVYCDHWFRPSPRP